MDVGINAASSGLLVVNDGSGTATNQKDLKVRNLVTTGAAASFGAGTISIGGTTQTTVGAAGAASALPAQPTGYAIINVAGTAMVIPYYAQA